MTAAIWRVRLKQRPGRLSAAGVRSGSAGQGLSYTRAHRLARSTTRVRSAMPPSDWAAFPKDAFPADASAAQCISFLVTSPQRISLFALLFHRCLACGNNADQISPFPTVLRPCIIERPRRFTSVVSRCEAKSCWLKAEYQPSIYLESNGKLIKA